MTRKDGSMRVLPAISLCATLAIALTLSTGCSDRVETPVYAADSTMVYLGKNADDVSVSITFASKAKVSKRTGRRLGVARVFEPGDRAKVHAFVDIANRHARGDRPLDFHLVWIKPNEKTAFKKRVEYVPSDDDTTLTSAMSIKPGKRNPGTYRLRVYLHRELIAEKSFLLLGTGEEAEAEEREALM
jgi:hypothetical protein